MVTAMMTTNEAVSELKSLAIAKARGEHVDDAIVQELTDAAMWERRQWLQLVRTASARRKASEMLASLEKQETIDLSDFAASRETLCAKCQAKVDELQGQIDLLEAEKREALAPLTAFDKQLADMHGRNQRVAIATDRSIAEMKQLLESTADKSIEFEIRQLTAERQRLQQGLTTIIRPHTSQAEALRSKDSRAIWRHEQADQEQMQLQDQLAKVERQLEKASAAKLDWKNFAAE